MKSSRCLVAALGAGVVCVITAIAVGQEPLIPADGNVSTSGARNEAHDETPRQSQLRNALDANASLVPWLLGQTEAGDDLERASARQALYALAPIGGLELIDGLANQNPAVRQTAMSLLPRSAESPSFPLNEAIAVLLKIVQDENEDDAFRKLAKLTVCRIICASQGVTIPVPQGRAA